MLAVRPAANVNESSDLGVAATCDPKSWRLCENSSLCRLRLCQAA